jgi:hypothetical protein
MTVNPSSIARSFNQAPNDQTDVESKISPSRSDEEPYIWDGDENKAYDSNYTESEGGDVAV